ncbi:hypothetical protein L218DRAFT_1079639 [Marasmius fiardii PR-910]|nr:hypothetical protein L218DRAFT_1079639 [Marasmius fiardii PR-910]
MKSRQGPLSYLNGILDPSLSTSIGAPASDYEGSWVIDRATVGLLASDSYLVEQQTFGVCEDSTLPHDLPEAAAEGIADFTHTLMSFWDYQAASESSESSASSDSESSGLSFNGDINEAEEDFNMPDINVESNESRQVIECILGHELDGYQTLRGTPAESSSCHRQPLSNWPHPMQDSEANAMADPNSYYLEIPGFSNVAQDTEYYN